MVHFVAPLIGAAALFSSLVSAAPLPSKEYAPPAQYTPPEGQYTPQPANQYAPPQYAPQPPNQYAPEPPKQYAPEPVKEVPVDVPPMHETPVNVEPPVETPVNVEPPVEPPVNVEPPVEPPVVDVPVQETSVIDTVVPPTETAVYEPPVATTPVYTPPQYGSGGNQWGNDYNSCVSKCLAQYGAPPAAYTPPPPPADAPVGETGAGKVHTVLVAPVKGVLRYVPPLLDVPTGDSVKFIWNGPANHTVAKSSKLDMCNKTADAFFTSGVQSGSFEFTKTVNDTTPVYFYCSVAQHCAKGMFGVINPAKGVPGSNMTVETMMPKWTAEYPDLGAAWKTIHEKTQGTPADTWGNKMDVASVPVEQQKGLAENILYYRSFLAENPGVQELDAGAALPVGTTEFKLPADITSLLSSTSGDPVGAANAAAGNPPTTAVPTGAQPTPSALNNGAGSLKSSGLMVAVVAIAATFFAL
jgi:plastocyanin